MTTPGPDLREDTTQANNKYGWQLDPSTGMYAPTMRVNLERTTRVPRTEWEIKVPRRPSPPINIQDDIPSMDLPQQGLVSHAYRNWKLRKPFEMDLEQSTMVTPREVYDRPTRTFTGADIRCVIHVAGNSAQSRPMIMANIQTLSYSVHREKVPVRALGHTYPVGFTRGGRTIAGSIIFTLFDREVLWDIIQSYAVDTEWNDESYEHSTYSPLLDQLPPFDITITFANEYGDVANMAIYGVELVDEGAVFSIDDLLVEKTCSFVARDIDMVRPYADAPNFRAFGKDVTTREVTNDDVMAFMNTLKARRDQANRTHPQSGDSVYRYDIPYDYAMFADTATQESKYGVIASMSEVIYTKHGVGWEGWANPEFNKGPNWYEFIPKLSIYPQWFSNSSYRIHDSKVYDGVQDRDVPNQYVLLVAGDGTVEAERSELQVK